MSDTLAKKRLTPAEAKAREERLRAAGITAANPAPRTSVITLLKRPTPRPAEDPLKDDDGSGVA